MPLPSPSPDPRHFARAVTELGEKRPVVARSAIYNAQGLKIIDKGVVIDARLYDRLTQHQLKAPLDDCLDSDPAVSGPGLRDDARALAAHDRFCAAMVADLKGGETLFEELALVPLPRQIGFQLTVLRETQPELWQHALRSALTAGWLAARSGLTRYDQRLLAAGGLLHDLGMLHLDPVLLRPQVQLTREQRRQLYTHPLVTVMLLERHHDYPKELLRAVLEHHEALDGSGYPRNVAGAELSPWGRVLALTELVTAMTADGREAPALRLSLALRMTAPRHDPALAREVMRLLAPLREAAPRAGDGHAADDLRQIEQLLGAWRTAAAAAASGLSAARRAAVERVAELCDAERKALAASGATAAQLAMLGEADADSAGELALIAREAAWQLRAVTRQARGAGSSPPRELPAPLQAWLDEAEALCARWLSRGDAAGPASTGSPAAATAGAPDPSSAG
ncbi:MAG: HD domain-containing protein [Rubrivivax sp.]|nr:HD domain-containing protein [Rubrivivax sp.]